VPSLNAPRQDLAAATAPGGLIYAITGASDADQSVEVYQPGSLAWDARAVPDLPFGLRATAATAGADGSVYVLGGFVDGSRLPGDVALVYRGGEWRRI